MTRRVLVLIGVNAGVFLLSMINPALQSAFAFSPTHFLDRPWTIVTYMFVHGDVMHILFNMLGLFFFGPRVEMYIGSTKFLWLYALSGLTGALLTWLITPSASIIGASGAVYGVIFGFAYFWPKELIYIWGVFPVQARWLVVAFTVLSLYGGLGAPDGIAHFAHLGGYVGAFLYLRWAVRDVNRPQEERRQQVRISQADLDRWNAIDRSTLHEVNREELDRIRAKLAEKNVVLTDTERAFLQRFSNG